MCQHVQCLLRCRHGEADPACRLTRWMQCLPMSLPAPSQTRTHTQAHTLTCTLYVPCTLFAADCDLPNLLRQAARQTALLQKPLCWQTLQAHASPLLPVGVLTLMAAARSVHAAAAPRLLPVQKLQKLAATFAASVSYSCRLMKSLPSEVRQSEQTLHGVRTHLPYVVHSSAPVAALHRHSCFGLVLMLHIKPAVALQSGVLVHLPSARSWPLLAASPMPEMGDPAEMPSAVQSEMLPLAVWLLVSSRVAMEQLPMSPTQSAGHKREFRWLQLGFTCCCISNRHDAGATCTGQPVRCQHQLHVFCLSVVPFCVAHGDVCVQCALYGVAITVVLVPAATMHRQLSHLLVLGKLRLLACQHCLHCLQ